MTTSDGAGRFELSGLSAGLSYRLLVLAPERATGLFPCGPFSAGAASPALHDLGELVLDPGGSLSGSVVQPQEPAGAQLVRLYWAGDEPAAVASAFTTHLETTRVDPRGRFAFDGLAAGRYRLTLVEREPGARDEAERTEALVELAPGENKSDLFLQPGVGTIAGTVLDPGGHTLSGCTVRLFARAAPQRELSIAYTNGRGRFLLHAHEPGPYRIQIEDRRLFCAPRSIDAVEIGAELSIQLDELHSTHEIRGRLVVESGAPLGNVYVGFRDSATQERLMRVAFPDADGRFTMKNLLDASYDVELVDFDGLYEPARVAGVRPEGLELELRLAPRR